MPEQQKSQLNDRVRLSANGRDGKVNAIYTDVDGTQYRVEYADASGTIHNHWARPGEFESHAG